MFICAQEPAAVYALRVRLALCVLAVANSPEFALTIDHVEIVCVCTRGWVQGKPALPVVAEFAHVMTTVATCYCAE